FILSLKDAAGRERFGTRHTIAPGQTIKFAEKMDKNYIKTFAIERVRFKRDTGDYAACDDERNSSKNTTPSSKPAPAKDTTAPKQIDVSPASGPANNAAAIKPPASSPSSANGCIWQSESGGDPFKLKKGDDGVYRTTINGSFGGSPTYPSAGNGTYQARTGHNPLFLSFMNNKRFGFSGPGIPLYDFSNCISGFENADVWVNVKGNYEVKLLETEGGVLFNGSGNIILYQTIAKDTYQTSDRPCTPDCYKTVIRITGKDTLSVDYTNLQGQINQTDDFVKKKKSPLAGQTSTTTANTSLIGAGEKPVVNGGATGEVNDKSLASIEGEYEGEGVFSNDKYKITLTSYGIAETNLIKNTDTVWPYKKISSDTYNLTMPQYGADATWTIKQIDNNTYQKFMRNDPTPYLYRRISPTPQGGTTGSTVAVRPVSLAGLWDGDNGGTGIITMTENGFDWKNQGQGFSSSFKKIASDSYRFDDGKNYCIVKFISDTKLDYACNGSHYAYFTRRK
ncbi:MAG: hypothetical protein KA831_06940, partial [Pyrinomonadaceae bacterium]|nr:hypothetical protein [Pyrinomonadaceae bacterium]